MTLQRYHLPLRDGIANHSLASIWHHHDLQMSLHGTTTYQYLTIELSATESSENSALLQYGQSNYSCVMDGDQDEGNMAKVK